MDNPHPWIMLPQPWLKWFSMDVRKCASEPCIRLMEQYPPVALADPWMGGFKSRGKIKSSNNNLGNITLSSLMINHPTIFIYKDYLCIKADFKLLSFYLGCLQGICYWEAISVSVAV